VPSPAIRRWNLTIPANCFGLTDVFAELCDEVLLAPADLSRQRLDSQGAAALPKQPPGPLDLRRRLHPARHARENRRVDQGERGFPRRRVLKTPDEVVGIVTQQVSQLHHAVSDRVHADAEEPPRAERGEVDLNPACLTERRGHHRRVVQPRSEDLAGPADGGGVALIHDVNRRPEADDHDDVGVRQLALRRRDSELGVAAISSNQRPQARVRLAPRHPPLAGHLRVPNSTRR
jgi:hypothetical protein